MPKKRGNLLNEQNNATNAEQFLIAEDSLETESQSPELASPLDDAALEEEEIEDELIIEDFTIDGICGVY